MTMIREYRIDEYPIGTYRLAAPTGDLARTTEGAVYRTTDRAAAEAALAYLTQDTGQTLRRVGSHRLKSMFGTIG